VKRQHHFRRLLAHEAEEWFDAWHHYELAVNAELDVDDKQLSGVGWRGAYLPESMPKSSQLPMPQPTREL
jgi:hypothetical protein